MSDINDVIRATGFDKILLMDEANKEFYRQQKALDKDVMKEIMQSQAMSWVKLFDYVQYLLRTDQEIPETIDLNDLVGVISQMTPTQIIYARRANNIIRKRCQRLRNVLEQMFEIGNCIFVSLTFRDDVLDSTTAETRRRYVTRALKAMSDVYVANIDYGELNEREHYHGIVVSDKIDFTLWDYGWIFAERCIDSQQSIDKLSEYIDKFVNHALKQGTKRRNVIYSKPIQTAC